MPPESVILAKLRAFQESGSTRHLDDVASMLRTLGIELDLDYVGREAARMEVFGTWRELLVRSGRGKV
jgi:hypothetical protein